MAAHPTDHEWQSWLAEHVAKFLLFARQQTRSSHDAEDVLQEALVDAWRRSGGQPESALVFATIRRRAIDLYRRIDKRNERETAADKERPHFVSPHAEREEAAFLENAVRHLPENQQEVITLKIWGGLTFAEIAEALEIPAGTAASRYRLALDALRQTLSSSLI